MNQLCTEKITYTHFLRLSGLLIVFCGFLLFVGCASVKVLPSEGNPPEWIRKQPVSDETVRFFVGAAQASDIGESKVQAQRDAQTKVAGYLNTEIILNEENKKQIESVQITVLKSANNAEPSTLSTGIENKKQSKNSESVIQSSAAYAGLGSKHIYYETVEEIKKGKQVRTYVKYWELFAISHENLKTARQAIVDGKSFEEQEKKFFVNLKDKYKNISEAVELLDFSHNNERYKKLFNDLLRINSDLQGLTTFKQVPTTIDDDLLVEYKELLQSVLFDIQKYDPTDKQKQEYESRIRSLEREKERIEQLSLTTNTEFASFQSDTDKKITDLYQKLELKEQEITSLERERNLVQNVLADYTTQIKSDFAAFATNEKNKTEKTAQTEEIIRELERSILLKENEVKTLEAQKNATEKALEKYTEQIKSDIASLVSSHSVNRDPEQKGESLVTNLKKQIAGKQSEIDALEKRLVNQAEQYTVLTQNTKPLETARLGLITEGENRFYIVSPGDTLVKIASYDFTYGDYRKWRAIYDANVSHLPNPQNPELLHPGIKLLLPD